MTTQSDEIRPANGNGKDGESAAGDDPQLARARDGHRSHNPATLPNAERARRVVEDHAEWAREVAARVWSGEFWDTQPPSPRELVDRARDGAWWGHPSGAVKFAARAGLVAVIAWSLPLYTVAVLGQRPGRAITALLVLGLFIYLL